MPGPRVKSSFGKAPKKGTKIRELLLLTLRREGVTIRELIDLDIKRPNRVIEDLRDNRGWDIRVFPLPEDDPRRAVWRGGGRTRVIERIGAFTVLRCVGRMRWDGSYRSFVNTA